MPAVQLPTTGGNSWFFFKSGDGAASGTAYSQTGESTLATTDSVNSTSTTYVNSAWIDAQGMNQIAITPNVTTGAGTTGFFKVQWSGDGTNLHGEDNYDASGIVASGEYQASTLPFVMTFASAATGVKQASLYVTAKKMRYFRISQRSDASVSLTATYHYQMS